MHFVTFRSPHPTHTPRRRAWRIWAPLLVLVACWPWLRHRRLRALAER